MLARSKTAASFRLDGRTILVTGATGGLGAACALACAQSGARVMATGRDRKKLDATLCSLPNGANGAHEGHPADLTALESIDSLVEAVAAVGGVDGVVHAAGIDGVSPWRQVGAEFLEKVWRANYLAPLLLTQRLLARKQMHRGGSILLFASVAAKAGKAGVGPYSGSKAALIGSMRPIALEAARHHIRVNALCPGIVDTPLFDGSRDWLFKDVAPTYPLGLGRPADIAWTTVYFLSDASRMVTGVAFSVDGGVPFV